MMTKVNKKFIEGMQAELDRKAPDFDGKHNPKFYENMQIADLWDLIDKDRMEVSLFLGFNNRKAISVKKYTRKKLIAIANRCWMIWEKLDETN